MDRAEVARQLLARSTSLNAYTRCQGAAGGCEVMVHLSGNGLCHLHGGNRDGIPEYLTSATDGSLIYARHISINLGSDCE